MILNYLHIFLFGLLCWTSLEGKESTTLLILNMNNEHVLPRNFRTTKDPFKIKISTPLPSRLGLNELNISGSAQFSAQALNAIVQKLESPSNLYILDLRQEFHGFLNGTAVSWYGPRDWANRDKDLTQIKHMEKWLLQSLLLKHRVSLYYIINKDKSGSKLPEAIAMPFIVNKVANEEDLVQKQYIEYMRIPVTDHIRPTDDSVDIFIQFVCKLPKNHWVHMHCAAGVGRTTTFMAMYDMMANAKKVSCDEILKRQWLLGGLNLQQTTDKTPWKYPYTIERIQFLQAFYEYCHNNRDNFEQSWTAYLSQVKQAA